jgi:filamentous hemagglutinin
MTRLLWLLMCVLVAVADAAAQSATPQGTAPASGASLPAACPGATLPTVFIKTGASAGLYVCAGAADTWVGPLGASGTSGGVLAFTGATTIASSAALAVNQIVLGGGAGAVPATLGSLGTTTTVLHGNAAGAPTFGPVSLTTDVSGDLPYSSLAQGSALSVLGVTGNATADVASIAAGSDHQVLRRSGTTLAFGALNLGQAAAITGTLPVGNGGTGLTSGTSGGVLAFTAAGTLASSGALTANLPVIGGGAGAVPTVGSRSGNTTTFATTSGTFTNGNCAKFDASGNIVDHGATCGGGGSPGGSDTQVQFNDAGSFGGDAGLTYNKTTDRLTLAGGLTNGSDYFAYWSSPNVSLDFRNSADSAFVAVRAAAFYAGTGGMALGGESLTAGSENEFSQAVWRGADRSINLIAANGISWSSTSSAGGTHDIVLGRIAANTLATKSGAWGTGAITGSIFTVGRNTSGGTAAGCVGLTRKSGTVDYLWTDTTGTLRLGSGCPEEDGTPADTSGTALGATGTIAVANGGTGLTAGNSGGVLAYTASGTIASSAALTANMPVIGGGAGVVPSVGTVSGNTTQFVTTTGTLTSGDCVTIDASGNFIANGSGCATKPVLAYLTTGQISTAADTNLVDVTGAAFTADAAGVYDIQIVGAVNNAANTTGYGIGINCAQTPQTVWITGSSQLANTGTTSTWSAIANNAVAGVTSGVPTNSTDVPIFGRGIVKAHASNSGTCTFRFRSEVAAVANLQAGSLFIVTKRN